MSIKELPGDVVKQLSASATITSINGVVEGLVKNSLDAGAHKISVSIDYGRGSCTVEDNGTGIPASEFASNGGLCKPNHTSRYPPRSDVHGRRGVFLASLAALCLLRVISRPKLHVHHSSISVHNSRVLERRDPAPAEQRLVASDHGTRITATDIFGSMPVRVRQRATISSERPSLDKQWAVLIRELVALLLAWPRGTSVTVREVASSRVLYLKSPAESELAYRMPRVLMQSSLLDAAGVDTWTTISASSSYASIKGCVSSGAIATRRCQFISIGVQPIPNVYGSSVLYEEVNRVFNDSTFGNIATFPEDGQPRLTKNLDQSSKDRIGRKAIEKWPAFCFSIHLKVPDTADAVEKVLDNQGMQLSNIVDLLKALCYGFLKSHGFQPQKVHLTSRTGASPSLRPGADGKEVVSSNPEFQPQPASVSAIRNQAPMSLREKSQNPFGDWNRVKIGRPTSSCKKTQEKAPTPTPSSAFSTTRLIGEGGMLLRKPFDVEGELPTATIKEPVPYRGGDPVGETEVKTISADLEDGTTGVPAKQGTARTASSTSTMRASCLDRKHGGEPAEWLETLWQNWENPIFDTADRAPPACPDTESNLAMPFRPQQTRPGANVMSKARSTRVSKEALLGAEVISQVDRKFLLVKLPLQPSEVKDSSMDYGLFVLDQHASDERCRLENLMESYFAEDRTANVIHANVEPLGVPLIFEVSRSDREVLLRYRDHFSTWGVVYEIEMSVDTQDTSYRVIVSGLPPHIFRRCVDEPQIVIDLLRKEVWGLFDAGVAPSQLRKESFLRGDSAMSRFRGCPRGILELLHSRSCRSAIMFNDVLSRGECEDLVKRLSKCSLPFQCAHGRPSIAPLLSLDSGHRIGGWRQDGDEVEPVSWRRWIDDE